MEPAIANLARMRRTYGDGQLSVVRGIVESLPFPNACFDLLWVRDVLVHVQSLPAAFAARGVTN